MVVSFLCDLSFKSPEERKLLKLHMEIVFASALSYTSGTCPVPLEHTASAKFLAAGSVFGPEKPEERIQVMSEERGPRALPGGGSCLSWEGAENGGRGTVTRGQDENWAWDE